MRERRSGLDVFDSSSFKGHWTTVAEGTKFQFQLSNNKLLITGRGPLLAPIFIGMTSEKRVEGIVDFKYIKENLEDTHSNRHR